MSGKLAGIFAINTNPLTNKFCMEMVKTNYICENCYSVSMLNGVRKNTIPKFQRNSLMLSNYILNRAQILNFVPIEVGTDIFRLHSHGELINLIHLKNFIEIANVFPNTIFVLWTKRKDLIDTLAHEIPENMIIIYSNPVINVAIKVPEHFDKVFTIYTKDYMKANNIKINCGGRKCRKCMICYKKNDITIINELLK